MCHYKTGSTNRGVCLYFNASQGNGVFNLASEMGWILWLSIWQFHFHTLRKWWFYTCWLSPCVKWLFHHCQRQMPWTPSCHTELLQRSLITTDKRGRETSIHCCAIFYKEYQSSNMCLYRRYCFHPQQQMSPRVSASICFFTKMPQTRKEAIYYQIPSWKCNTGVIHHLFQGRCTAAGH